ncbi:MAG: hypothetical protein LBD68_07225 [Zoogloeaceae bacterium]|jgi:hypothetical protein|nr:hypothetical protein [Zoogloeaceae bacterium]
MPFLKSPVLAATAAARRAVASGILVVRYCERENLEEARKIFEAYHKQNHSDEVRWVLEAIADMGDFSLLQSARTWGDLHLKKSREAGVSNKQEAS